jgi:hypothetical protein
VPPGVSRGSGWAVVANLQVQVLETSAAFPELEFFFLRFFPGGGPVQLRYPGLGRKPVFKSTRRFKPAPLLQPARRGLLARVPGRFGMLSKCFPKTRFSANFCRPETKQLRKGPQQQLIGVPDGN